MYPGENELKALSENALAVLRGERSVKTYVSEDYDDPSKINDTSRRSKLRDVLLATIMPPKGNKPMTAVRQYLRKFSPRKN